MKILTYKRAMSYARRYIRLLWTIEQGAPNWRDIAEGAARWKAVAVKLAHSDAERERAEKL